MPNAARPMGPATVLLLMSCGAGGGGQLVCALPSQYMRHTKSAVCSLHHWKARHALLRHPTGAARSCPERPYAAAISCATNMLHPRATRVRRPCHVEHAQVGVQHGHHACCIEVRPWLEPGPELDCQLVRHRAKAGHRASACAAATVHPCRLCSRCCVIGHSIRATVRRWPHGPAPCLPQDRPMQVAARCLLCCRYCQQRPCRGLSAPCLPQDRSRLGACSVVDIASSAPAAASQRPCRGLSAPCLPQDRSQLGACSVVNIASSAPATAPVLPTCHKTDRRHTQFGSAHCNSDSLSFERRKRSKR
eukprot:365475-Chlamydomonas_euryale.AAC.2